METQAALKVLVIIPCFNEAKSIITVLTELKEHCPHFSLLVIDDGSGDDTSQLAAAHATVVRLPINLGIGGAVQTGIRYAFQNGYDFCLQVDGDGQHPAIEIHKFFTEQRKTLANLVIGSRFLDEEGFQSTQYRRFGIKILQYLIRLCTRLPITDPTSGFRLMDRKAIALFNREYPHDYPEPTSLAIAAESGLLVKEISVVMRDRYHGASSITGTKIVSYMIRVSCSLLLVRLRRYL